MSNQPESSAAERAAAGASRKAYVEQHGSLPAGDGPEQRSLHDVVNDPYVVMAAGAVTSKVYDAVKEAVKRPPGDHEKPKGE
jgi:hypothetical protein